MGNIIDIQRHIRKKEDEDLKKIKEDLNYELEIMAFDIDSELNKYVIFDTSQYYELSKENKKEVLSIATAMKHLLTAFDMLVRLNEQDAAVDVDNLITRLENHSY